ncbi:type II secretion system protein [Stenotrophomonas pigmentata]|uniref:type II secretion system protein n=1 Tax=Stenotrophomonas pigmentata TaxID=3055080 RepID=UPI0026EAA9E0|nr:prepilin-type N-terminal cleavage/methylation domain-containing protein [Stenotrophomonas sp. 610A2]
MRQRGYSLMEIMLVLGVIAIAVVGIFATFTTTNFNRKINQTNDDLIEITQNIEQSWGNMQSYNGLTNELAVQQHLIPDRIKNNGGLKTPLGPLTLGYAGNDREMLLLTLDLENDGCNRLIPLLAPHMHQIKIGRPGQLVTVAEEGHVNLSEVGAWCSQGLPVSFIHFQKGFGRRAIWESW